MQVVKRIMTSILLTSFSVNCHVGGLGFSIDLIHSYENVDCQIGGSEIKIKNLK